MDLVLPAEFHFPKRAPPHHFTRRQGVEGALFKLRLRQIEPSKPGSGSSCQSLLTSYTETQCCNGDPQGSETAHREMDIPVCRLALPITISDSLEPGALR